jgi:hypothetical protein
MNLRVRLTDYAATADHDAPGLTEARGILADIAHYEDHDIALACQAVMALSDCANERARARELLALVERAGLAT